MRYSHSRQSSAVKGGCLTYRPAWLADQEALKLILDKFGQGAMLNAT